MGRDSNPRYLAVHTLSRRAQSTALAPIRKRAYEFGVDCRCLQPLCNALKAAAPPITIHQSPLTPHLSPQAIAVARSPSALSRVQPGSHSTFQASIDSDGAGSKRGLPGLSIQRTGLEFLDSGVRARSGVLPNLPRADCQNRIFAAILSEHCVRPPSILTWLLPESAGTVRGIPAR